MVVLGIGEVMAEKIKGMEQNRSWHMKSKALPKKEWRT